MRVAMVTTLRDACGIADYARRLVDALRPHAEVEVLSLDRSLRAAGRPFFQALAGRANQHDLVHIQHEYSFFGGGIFPPESGPLARLQREPCHFFDFVRALTGSVVMTLHELWAPDVVPWRAGPGRALKNALLRQANRLTYQSVDGVITHSDERKAKLVGLGIPGQRVTTIPMGIPAPPARPAPAAGKDRFGLAGRFVVAMFGFVVARKGYDTALELLTRLPGSAVLLIAGGRAPNDRSDYFDQLQRRVVELGLAERVRITGYLDDDDVALALAASDVGLAPFEDMGGSSASIATAVGYGLPVVAWSLPQMEEIQQRMGGLTLVARGDREALRAAVAALAADAAGVRSPARAGATVVHGCAEEAAETVQVYRRILAGRAVRPPRPRWRWREAARTLLAVPRHPGARAVRPEAPVR